MEIGKSSQVEERPWREKAGGCKSGDYEDSLAKTKGGWCEADKGFEQAGKGLREKWVGAKRRGNTALGWGEIRRQDTMK